MRISQSQGLPSALAPAGASGLTLFEPPTSTTTATISNAVNTANHGELDMDEKPYVKFVPHFHSKPVMMEEEQQQGGDDADYDHDYDYDDHGLPATTTMSASTSTNGVPRSSRLVSSGKACLHQLMMCRVGDHMG